MRVALRKIGNLWGVPIPNSFLRSIGVGPNGEVDVTADGDRILVRAVKGKPRDGWALASRAIAETGRDALVWPEFGNQDDERLSW